MRQKNLPKIGEIASSVTYDDDFMITEATLELPGGVILRWAAGVGPWTDEEGQPDV